MRASESKGEREGARARAGVRRRGKQPRGAERIEIEISDIHHQKSRPKEILLQTYALSLPKECSPSAKHTQAPPETRSESVSV